MPIPIALPIVDLSTVVSETVCRRILPELGGFIINTTARTVLLYYGCGCYNTESSKVGLACVSTSLTWGMDKAPLVCRWLTYYRP